MERNYVEAELEIIELQNADIVTASGGISEDEYNNGTHGWGGYH